MDVWLVTWKVPFCYSTAPNRLCVIWWNTQRCYGGEERISCHFRMPSIWQPCSDNHMDKKGKSVTQRNNIVACDCCRIKPWFLQQSSIHIRRLSLFSNQQNKLLLTAESDSTKFILNLSIPITIGSEEAVLLNDLRFPQRWLRRMLSSGMWRHLQER
jgi:hypothetical protein